MSTKDYLRASAQYVKSSRGTSSYNEVDKQVIFTQHARDGVNPPIPLKPPKNSHPPEPDRKTQSHQ